MSNQPAPVVSQTSAADGAGRAASAAIDLGAVIAELKKAGRTALADQLAAALDERVAIEARLAEPTLALAIADGTGVDEHIHIRGSHKNLGEVVPRRFLEVLGGSDSPTRDGGSGRLDLARTDGRSGGKSALCHACWSTGSGNTISAKGSSRSTDDFGAMGQKPSHPELLDWLAGRARRAAAGRSKAMHRLMVTSSTYRMSSVPPRRPQRLDPATAVCTG